MLVVLRRFVPTLAALLTLAGCTSTAAHRSTPSASPPTTPSTTQPSTSTPSATRTTATRRTTSAPPSRTSSPPAATGHAPAGLPLAYATGSATRVITVVAPSTGSTTATLQAWQKTAAGWTRYGSGTTAYLGADGLSAHPSETLSATPIGSFTLTQAFGALSNPGTGLPYIRTTAADWWISQAGPLYNTHQHCSSNCPFDTTAPTVNEHLVTETPYYNYAVVIDYNTRNSPTGVRAGAGSAFFLHVTVGAPTAGCVSIPQATLVALMRWLTPAADPRILIGVG